MSDEDNVLDSDLGEVLYKHTSELTDREHVKLGQAIQALINQRIVEELEMVRNLSDHRLYKEGTIYEINGKHIEHRIKQLKTPIKEGGDSE